MPKSNVPTPNNTPKMSRREGPKKKRVCQDTQKSKKAPRAALSRSQAQVSAESKASKAAVVSVKPRKPSLLTLAAEVLAASKEPMSAKQIVEKIVASGSWSSQGKTPEATLYSAMTREIAAKGASARFVKVTRGQFTARPPA